MFLSRKSKDQVFKTLTYLREGLKKTEESETLSALGEGGWGRGGGGGRSHSLGVFLLLNNLVYVFRKPQNKLCVHS